jgi:Fe-S cluster assembly scaffold protein SufB
VIIFAFKFSGFSDGSFCYVPQNVICPLELSTYFRINDKDSGQFERTLILLKK